MTARDEGVLLSKGTFLLGLSCKKNLHLNHSRTNVAMWTAALLNVFRTNNMLNVELAARLYPEVIVTFNFNLGLDDCNSSMNTEFCSDLVPSFFFVSN